MGTQSSHKTAPHGAKFGFNKTVPMAALNLAGFRSMLALQQKRLRLSTKPSLRSCGTEMGHPRSTSLVNFATLKTRHQSPICQWLVTLYRLQKQQVSQDRQPFQTMRLAHSSQMQTAPSSSLEVHWNPVHRASTELSSNTFNPAMCLKTASFTTDLSTSPMIL